MEKELINNFLKNPLDENCSKKGYDSLLSVFVNVSKKFSFSKEEITALYNEFIIVKLLKNTTFQRFVNTAKDEDILPYTTMMMRNFFIDIINKEKKFFNNNFDIEILKEKRFSIVIFSEALILLDIIDKNFKLKEKKILCKYINKQKYGSLINMREAAFYKAIERLKRKLSKHIKQDFSKEATNLFFSQIYLSEICEKISVNK